MGTTTRSSSRSPTKSSAPLPAKMQSHREGKVALIILPKDASTKARILELAHPYDQKRRKFFFCPDKGLFDVTKVSSPEQRSTILSRATDPNQSTYPTQKSSDESTRISDGYINSKSDLFITTPFDPAILLLPILPSTFTGSSRKLFQPLDDLLEDRTNKDLLLRWVIRNGKQRIEEALTAICDTVEAGDETMFRVNEEKILRWLVSKAEKVVEKGLPASMEETFVTRALETPVLSVKREESTTTVVIDEDNTEPNSPLSNQESQSTTVSSAASAVFSEVSTTSTSTSLDSDTVPSEMKRLQRTRTAINFILYSYMPDSIMKKIQQRLSSPNPVIDFKPLDEHLVHLATLRAEALAMRSLGDFSRKRAADDEDAAEARAEKKRKQEEDDKRKKAGESRGVRDLKKVNIAGMKKMSDFFAVKPAAKAKN